MRGIIQHKALDVTRRHRADIPHRLIRYGITWNRRRTIEITQTSAQKMNGHPWYVQYACIRCMGLCYVCVW